MSRVRQIVAAGGTFSVALGIGFVMQNGDALASRFGEQASVQVDPLAQPLGAPVAQIAPNPAMPAPAPSAAVAALALSDVGPGDVIASLATRADRAIGLLTFREHRTAQRETEPETLAELAGFLPEMPQDPVTLAMLGDFDGLSVGLADELFPDELTAESAISDPSCDVTVMATAAPAAMIDLAISAPCVAGGLVTVHHQGMMFSLITDAAGQAAAMVPALAEEAVVIVEARDGKSGTAVVSVPEVASVDRAVLQWQGDAGLELHALEFGAGYGGPGHVWAEATRDPAVAEAGTGGFLQQLGDRGNDNTLRAEVYTYPSAGSVRGGEVLLNVEARVTAANCGREVSAQSIQVTAGGAPRAIDLTLPVPGCDAVGEFLVLSSMLQDLVVAAR